MSANEIRSLEDMNSYDGGDEYFVQMNMQPMSQLAAAKISDEVPPSDAGRGRKKTRR